jgi:plastocyanin
MKNSLTNILAVFCIVIAPPSTMAVDEKYELTIKNHQFQPNELNIPAGQKIKLLIKNLDDTPEEFESNELNLEKVIMGNASASIFVGPLKPGIYPFFGEFHSDSAQGKLHVK